MRWFGEELLTTSSSPILTALGAGVVFCWQRICARYFAVMASQPHWRAGWSKEQRVMLWVVAFCSTFAPDLDVIYNWLFRGFFNHSVLWTHSIFLHLGICLCWWLLRRSGRWPYVQVLLGLAAIGGLSHLALDVVSHAHLCSIRSLGHSSEHHQREFFSACFWATSLTPFFCWSL